MSELIRVLLLATLPVAGHLGGVVLSELVKPPRWVNGALLHGAAGISMAILAVELIPRATDELAPTVLGPAVFAGAMASLAVVGGLGALRRGAGGTASGWMVYAAIVADLVSDGLITGAGSATALELGGLLAASQLVANLPGGFAANANLRSQGAPARSRRLAAAAIAVPSLLAATLGYLALRGAPPAISAGCLAVIGGFLLAATLEDLVPEGDAPRPPRWSSTLALATGFAGIAAVSGLAS